MFKRKRAPIVDEGLQQIDEWFRAFTAFNAERLAHWPDDDLLAAERLQVAAVGDAISARMRSDFLARTQ
jgi:hypothetical protein